MADYPDYNNTEYSHYTTSHDPREHNVVEAIKNYATAKASIINPNDEDTQMEELTKALQLLAHSSLNGLGYAASGHTGFCPDLTTISGYDATKTQTLKNDSGTLKWVTDSSD